MTQDTVDFFDSSLLRAAVAQIIDQCDEHPAIEALLGYTFDPQGSPEDDLIQDHCSMCRHCCFLVLEIQSFLDAGKRTEPESPEENLAAAWQELRLKLSQVPRYQAFPPMSVRHHNSLSRWWALAAALACAFIGGYTHLQSSDNLTRATTTSYVSFDTEPYLPR